MRAMFGLDCLPLQIIDKAHSFNVTSTEVSFQVPDLFTCSNIEFKNTILKLSLYNSLP